MPFPSLLVRVHPPYSSRIWSRTFGRVRRYATHRNINHNSSLLSQSLDQNSKQDKGPFQLGLGLGQPAVQTGERVPKWSELSTAGKGNTRSLAVYFCYLPSTSEAVNRTYHQFNRDLAGSRTVCCSHLFLDFGTFLQKLAHCSVQRCLRTNQSILTGS